MSALSCQTSWCADWALLVLSSEESITLTHSLTHTTLDVGVAY